jgi:hypothetical protein
MVLDPGPPPQFDPQARIMGDLGRRIRAVEDRMNEISERSVVTADTVNKKTKEMDEVMGTVVRTVSALQKDVNVLKMELAQLRKEISRAATTNKVDELEGYINMIDPMKFVTRDEVKRMIQEAGRE